MERPSHSTIKVKIGTFKSGKENIQLHHWSNAKPANMRDGAQEATMKPRGRPRKTSSHSDGQNTTDSSGPASDQNGGQVNKPPPNAVGAKSETKTNSNSNVGGKRSTRNPNPIYVDAIEGPPPYLGFPQIQRPWSASPEKKRELNTIISPI